MTAQNAPPMPALSRAHWSRLRQMVRSAGWPCHDALELDLLAAGLLERITPSSGHVFLQPSPAGLQALSTQRRRNQHARSTHAELVQRVAEQLALEGRIAYAELPLRAKPGDRWLRLRPDVFSIRHTTRSEGLAPMVHEIKTSRADLLGDLRNPDKRAGYRALAGCCYYVLAEGIADPSEVPEECGVLQAEDACLRLLRAAPRAAVTLDFGTWMALARATPVPVAPDPQPSL